MGAETGTYITRTVAAMQAAYGNNWNITAKGSDPVLDDRAWLVQVGYDDFKPEIAGNLGMHVKLTALATVSYRGKGATHNSGLQAADITATLGAWVAAYVDPETNTIPHNFDMEVEPIVRYELRGTNRVAINTGDYRGRLWWDVILDFVDVDIDVEGYDTGHPARPSGPYVDHSVNVESVSVDVTPAV